MSAESSVANSPLAVAQAELELEMQHVQEKTQEVEMLIRQSRGETETLARRELQVSNRLRQIESNLDSYSREEIREIYTAAREAQMRLFLMRSQVEQLEQKRTTFQQYTQQLEKLRSVFDTLDSAPPPEPPLPEAPAAVSPPINSQQTIIRIIDAQEKERQILARQMHDGPASSLSNLVLQAEVVERLFNLDPAQARAELSALKTAVNTTFQRTRDFIFNLRPMMLDDLGLLPTLRRFVQDYSDKTKIATQLTIMGKDRRLPAHSEVIIFRVMQELLNNVTRHANATKVQISLDVGDEFVSATVEDNGAGFDVQQTLEAARERKTLGISSILERIEMLGGEIHFESHLGRGSRVSLRVPALE